MGCWGKALSVREAGSYLPAHVRRALYLLLDLGSPEGIAVDHLGRNLFWTDSRLDRIEVAKLDGTQRRVLFETDLVNPRGIVTDSVRGYLGVVCVCVCHTCAAFWVFSNGWL